MAIAVVRSHRRSPCVTPLGGVTRCGARATAAMLATVTISKMCKTSSIDTIPKADTTDDCRHTSCCQNVSDSSSLTGTAGGRRWWVVLTPASWVTWASLRRWREAAFKAAPRRPFCCTPGSACWRLPQSATSWVGWRAGSSRSRSGPGCRRNWPPCRPTNPRHVDRVSEPACPTIGRAIDSQSGISTHRNPTTRRHTIQRQTHSRRIAWQPRSRPKT